MKSAISKLVGGLLVAATTVCLAAGSTSAPRARAGIPAVFNNPVYTGYLADPYCWYYDGMYYAIGTAKGADLHDKTKNVPMIKSRDLQHWEFVGFVLNLPKEEQGGLVWAPETAYNNSTFYLYYHANGSGKGFRIRVATSKNPEGPYTDTGTPLTDVTKNDFAIDSTTFRDDDGQWYMFYATDFTNHDATTFRGTALVMDRLIDMTRLEGKPETVMRAHWAWQIYQHNRNMRGEVADWYTLEGPGVLKRNGKYYCFYSGGNYQNDSYGVDYLVADNIHGPWTEVGRNRGPQILRSIPGKVRGPGHHSIVSSPDGKRDFIVYHAWDKSMTDRQVWVDPLVWTKEGPRVERYQARIAEMNRKAEETSSTDPNQLPGLRRMADFPLRDTSVCPGPDGTWYLTGTVPPFWSYNEGIKVWKSKDMESWEPLGFVWKYGSSPWHKKYLEAKKPLWAPEIHYLKGTFWLTYSLPGWDGTGKTSGCGLLKSTSGRAEGPYVDVQPEERLGDEIDASLFEDHDGSVYFLWHSAKIARMKPDMSGLAEPYHWLRTSTSDPDPEHHSGLCAGIFGAGSFDHVGFEGVYLFRANGRYYLSCAESFEGRYSCMMATSTNLYGPYSARYEAIPHGGHNMFFQDDQHQWWSTYFGSDGTAPWREKPGRLPIHFDQTGKVVPGE